MALCADVTRLFTIAMPVNWAKIKIHLSKASALSFKSNNAVTTGAAQTWITQSLKQERLKSNVLVSRKMCPISISSSYHANQI